MADFLATQRSKPFLIPRIGNHHHRAADRGFQSGNEIVENSQTRLTVA